MASRLQGIYPEKLSQQLGTGKVLPVYYFAGDDRYEKARAREKILALTEPDGSCVHKFTGAEVQAGNLIALAQSLSLFGGSRLIWVEDAHRVPAAAKKPLADYLADPNPSTCLVFASDDWRTDAGDPLTAGAQAQGGLVHFRAPTGERLIAWAAAAAKAHGIAIEPEAAERLIAEAGEDRVILAQELERLALYKKGSGVRGEGSAAATVVDVLECLGYTEGEEIRDLEHALAAAMAERTQEARKRAFRIVERLLEEGEEPVKVSNYIGYAVQHLMAAKRLQAAGFPAAGVKAKVGAWGNEAVASQALRIPEARLLKGLRHCLDTDVRLKTGASTPDLEVRELVLRLTA